MGAFIAKQPNGLYCRYSYIVDNITHHNMTDEQQLSAWKYITKAMNEHIPKSDDLNQLLQFLLSQWGEWEYGDYVCECCGDTVDEATLIL